MNEVYELKRLNAVNESELSVEEKNGTTKPATKRLETLGLTKSDISELLDSRRGADFLLQLNDDKSFLSDLVMEVKSNLKGISTENKEAFNGNVLRAIELSRHNLQTTRSLFRIIKVVAFLFSSLFVLGALFIAFK